MSGSVAAALPEDAANPNGLLHTLLTMSLTGVALLQPVYAADEATIDDFAWVQLNPAAQQMLGQPACPPESLLTLFPAARQDGVFEVCCRAFMTGQLQRNETNYQQDGLDGYFLLVAQRYEGLLVVNFTDTNDRPRSAVETALRESQARELAAHAEAEAARADLAHVFEQAPAMICIFEGPQHTFQFVNPPYQALVGERPLLGLPIARAMPELADQPIFALLDRVYQTGETFHAAEMLVQLDHANTGPAQLEHRYYNFIYQARRDRHGAIDGILVFAYDVTAQALARQQVQNLNQELASINEELRATNEEYLNANTALHNAQQALQQLNEELELRVAARSAEARAALVEAEHQAEQVREQQRLLRQILGQVPAAIATFSGPEHRYSFFNQPYQALSADRLTLGRAVADGRPQPVAPGFEALLDQVYATGQPYRGAEVAAHHYDPATGQLAQRYVDLLCQPLFSDLGPVQGVLAFSVDVTEKVLARQQAEALQAAVLAAVQRQGQERENVFQLFEQAPAAICLLREPSHRIDYLNPAYQALFPGRQLQGSYLAQAQPEAPELVQLLDSIYASGQPQRRRAVPVSVPQEAGQPVLTKYFDFVYQAYREAGKLVGVSIFGFEVTDQVLAQRDADQQRELLQQLFLKSPLPIVIHEGPNLVFQLVNPAYQRIFPGRRLQGRPLLEALPEAAHLPLLAALAQVYQTGRPYEAEEVHLQLATYEGGPPEDIYASFTYQARRNVYGVVDGVFVFAVVVTEQVLARQRVQELNEELAAINEEMQVANEELNDTNTQLTRTNTDLDTFVYTASHDLKAPIANIEGLLTALRQDLPAEVLQDELVCRLLELMDGAVARFQRTIAQLTDIARLQHDEPAETVPLAAIAEAVCLDLAPLVEATQAQLHLDTGACPTVRVPARTLRSVLYNLLSNALKYRDPSRVPIVTLRCQPLPGGRVQLAVQDNGLGLSSVQQGKLFSLFRRLHTHVEGSGVGLFTVKRLVENAGGTIAVQSVAGEGSTFTVTLPA